MMPETKICSRCFEDKPISEYYLFKSGPQAGHIKQPCKHCTTQNAKNYRILHPDKIHKYNTAWKKNNPDKVKQQKSRYYQKYIKNPDNIKNNPTCTLYLGYYISESVLSKSFKNITRMPANNPGYDFECDKHHKIDVKSSVILHNKSKHGYWSYIIKENKIPDYFLIIAWDSRENLNPLHIWLIPGKLINHKKILYIGNSKKSIGKWKKYSKPTNIVENDCNVFKSKKEPIKDSKEIIYL